MNQDTIAAIATAAGEGAISIIRVSGKEAFPIVQKIFSGNLSSYKTHTAHMGKIFNSQKAVVDHVLLLIMKGPKSYTGEDIIEICCHGGSLITKKVLQEVLNAGARPANPGEFSLRAFLNGRLDLAQAEAVQKLICAKNELALKQAENQLEGALSKKILSFQKKITEVAAILEASIDFPEEGLEFATPEDLQKTLHEMIESMQKLHDTFDHGKMIHSGINLCLYGSPNVGKSSLMNALLGKDRAIVTDIAGTTRDVLEEDLKLGSLHFRIIDTAGIRDTLEVIEKEGIKRSLEKMRQADLVLLLLDASREVSETDFKILESSPLKKTLVIWNKIDLKEPPSLTTPHKKIAISAKENIGLENLQKAIEETLWQDGHPSKEEVTIQELRHKQALFQAIESLKLVRDGLLNGTSPEFTTSDLRSALLDLGKIIGTNVSEDILSEIFSKFCLGK